MDKTTVKIDSIQFHRVLTLWFEDPTELPFKPWLQKRFGAAWINPKSTDDISKFEFNTEHEALMFMLRNA